MNKENTANKSENLVEIRDLSVRYRQAKMSWGKETGFTAVDAVNFSIKKGEILGLVGETGSGKSSIGRSILGLIPFSGQVSIADKRIDEMNHAALKEHRRHMQIIFQDPLSSLNRRKNIRSLMTQGLNIQKIGTKEERERRVISLLQEVGFDESILKRFPHQFSGGQRQRISIARALTVNPSFVVCDEAVSALDVSVQASIINLLLDLRKKHDLTYLFISHDLSVIELISDRIIVLYLGRIVEEGYTDAIMKKQLHPYTKMLFDASPSPTIEQRSKSLQKVQGEIPQRSEIPKGCFFASRCPFVMKKCREMYPSTINVTSTHRAACWLYEDKKN